MFVAGPHAAATSARAASIEPALNIFVLMVLLRMMRRRRRGWISLTLMSGLLSI
jgi:hypothetical protein